MQMEPINKELDSSEWLKLHDSIDSDLTNSQSELNDGSLTARQRRNISGKLKISKESMIQLEKSLNKMEINPIKYKIGDGEVQRRKGLLSQLRAYHNTIENSLDGEKNRTGRGWKNKQLEETDETAPLTNQQLLQRHQDQIESQDQKLDGILDGVSRLKMMSQDIHTELNLHGELLNDLDQAIDHTDSKIVRNTQRIDIIEEKSKGCATLLCMMMLLGVIIMLLATNWFCHIFNSDKC